MNGGAPIEPLGSHKKLLWEARPGAEGGRKARQAGRYEAFVPTEIAGRRFALDDDVIAQIASATKALAHLNTTSPPRASLSALADALMRSESTASSWIEGLAVSHKRLARAAFGASEGSRRDVKATEILGNVEAMKHAIELGAGSRQISVDDIREIHRILLRFSPDRRIAGVIREKQNWIGTNPYTPIGADYVPPPPEYVLPLLEDLCRFLARDDLAPIAQAALAHAQFENIHPFADGNGRVGRTLIHTVLCRGGEATNYVPPISLVLGATPKAYVAGFGDFSRGDVSSWCDLFAAATRKSASEAERMAAQIDERQGAWLERLGNPRADAVVRQLIAQLPGQPVMDVAAGRRLTGKSHEAVRNALVQLEGAGIMRSLNERKWRRLWECDELLELIEDFEESVRRPAGAA
jgi:Fic family protein